MRAPSLLAQCLPGLVPQDKGSHSSPSISERDIHLPSPAVEILPSKAIHLYFSSCYCKTALPYKYAGENVDLQGLNVFKGRFSVADIMGLNSSESTSSKPEGHLKSWDSSMYLVNVLKYEICDGQLSFRGKKVLELGCSYGLPGVFACLKGASIVHFQDMSAETIRCITIPNVLANLEQARDRQSRQPESPLTPSRHALTPSVHFYAGDWEELPTVLSVVRGDGFEAPTGMSLSFSEEDFMDGCSSQDGSIIGHESSSRRSRKLSASRAWERANEIGQEEGGYDIVLMAEIPYSLNSLKKLYALIKKCVRPPYGVLYLATKKNYVGFNNGARHLRSLVDEEGVFGAHLVEEMTDRDIWKFFLK
ncbi:histidine protein methyltransferase 1 homolog isoform X1 [Cucurbita maxima]|uniref:Histidine protein methyltransferase 1 homolog isoform X1 n=1 Tax=Cucurbita maxima TaxID=3661 RepID=A0A6J1IXP6_CUCMA|nr:histidine protein methyltransferase 1 homolog isoform X1 [Cucurbita maxima]